MTFMNWAMLAGVLAFGVPLLIHLFNRSKFKVVEWGAMHLLHSVVRVNRKRLKVEQLILLLIRCAIPVILALVMARPVITGWRSLSGDVPTSTVVLLDASYSMGAGGAGRTHFAAAQEHTTKILNGLKRGSEAAVVVMGSGAAPLTDKPSFDPAAMSKLVAMVEPIYGPIDTDAAIDTATGILAKATHAKRDLLLVSDFQGNNWEQMQGAATRRLGELIGGANVPPSVTFLRVGEEASDNVSIDGIELSRPVVGVGQELRIRAKVVNHAASRAVDNLRLHFRIDGEQKDIAQINLGPGEQRDVLFAHKFETPGSHLIRVDTVADELTADNESTLAVAVLDRIPVLLVDGDPSGEPLAGETDYLDIALRPYTASRGKLADLIEATVIPAAKLAVKDLVGPSVVILANVPRLDDALVEALRQFVQQGGGSLIVFPGNRIDVDWYNRVLAAGPAPLLPAPIAALAGDLRDTTKQSSVLAQRYDHPAMAIFNDSRNGDLSTVNAWMWYRFELGGDATAPAAVDRKVLARLSTGDPLLIERPLGEGLVIAAATSADADWSNMPLRPVFLPLIQQVTTYAASRSSAPRNVAVDHPIVALLGPDMLAKPFVLTDPTGKKHELTATARDRRAVIEFAHTRRPGVYRLEGPEGFDPLAFVVQAPRSESRIARLEDAKLAEAAKALGADIVADAAAYASLDATRSHGREIWRSLLLAVLVLLFGELLLQQYFTRTRT